MHVRVCRGCGEEYRPEIAVCADCGEELVDQHGDEPLVAERPAGEEGGAGEPEQPLVVAVTPRDLTGLADELIRAGLPFRIAPAAESDPDRRGFELRVPESALAAARRALGPVVERDLDRLYVEVPAFESEPGEEEAPGPPSSCPACEAPLAGEVAECPACGLVLGAPPES